MTVDYWAQYCRLVEQVEASHSSNSKNDIFYKNDNPTNSVRALKKGD